MAYWAGDPKGQGVLESGWPGVRVVEKLLLEGEQDVTIAINPLARRIIGSTHALWEIGKPNVEHLRRAQVSEDMTIELGRRLAVLSDQPVGWAYNDDNERVLLSSSTTHVCILSRSLRPEVAGICGVPCATAGCIQAPERY